jgi:hypothetical protein
VLDQLEELHKKWMEAFVFEHRFFNTIESFNLDDERSVFSSYGMQIFIELSRMHFLIHVPTWQEEQRELAERGEAAKNLSITWALSDTKSRHWLEDNWPNWDKPIVQYTQSEIKFAIAYLCERILDFPSADPLAMGDFSTFLFILMTHNARFFCVQNTAEWMDIPEMRVASDPDTPELFNFNRDYAMYRRPSRGFFVISLR